MTEVNKKTVSKDDIAQNISQEMGGVSKSQTVDLIDDLLNSIVDIVEEKGKIRIKNFGNFSLKTTKERIGRNPLTKEEYPIESKNIISFKAHQKLKDFVSSKLN